MPRMTLALEVEWWFIGLYKRTSINLGLSLIKSVLPSGWIVFILDLIDFL